MDAPPIQYARTEDGVNIAYWTLGKGPVLVHGMMAAGSHLELEWRVPSLLAGEFSDVLMDQEFWAGTAGVRRPPAGTALLLACVAGTPRLRDPMARLRPGTADAFARYGFIVWGWRELGVEAREFPEQLGRVGACQRQDFEVLLEDPVSTSYRLWDLGEIDTIVPAQNSIPIW